MCTVDDAISAVVGVVEVIGMVQHNKAETAKSKYRIEVLNQQAQTAKKEAVNTRQEGIEESRRKKLKSILLMNEEAARYAANNIALSSQTAVNSIDDYKLNGELDALNTIKNYEKRAQSYERQAQQYYQNAALTAFNNKLNTQNNLFNAGLRLVKFGQSSIKHNEKFLTNKFKELRNAN